MVSSTEKYLERVRGLTLHRDISLKELAETFNILKERPNEQTLIRVELIERLLKYVGSIAQKISAATRVDLEDLIGEGNLLVTEFYAGDRVLSPNSWVEVYPHVYKKLRKYALNQLLKSLPTESLKSNVAQFQSQNLIESFRSENMFSSMDQKIQEILTPREYKVFTLHSPLYGENLVYREIVEKITPIISAGRAEQIYMKSLRKFRAIFEIDDATLRDAFRDTSFSPSNIT